MKYIGSESIIQFGQATRAAYPFEPGQVRNIDRRDVVYILGGEFEEVG